MLRLVLLFTEIGKSLKHYLKSGLRPDQSYVLLKLAKSLKHYLKSALRPVLLFTETRQIPEALLEKWATTSLIVNRN